LRDLEEAVRELYGDFIPTEKSRNRTFVRFHNPSVKDFVINYLRSSEDELMSLVQTVRFHDQISWLWRLDDHESQPIFRPVLAKHSQDLVAAFRHTLHSPDCLLTARKDEAGRYSDISK